MERSLDTPQVPLTGVCIWCFPLRCHRFLRVRRRARTWFRKQQCPGQPVCLAPKRCRKAISLPSPQIYTYPYKPKYREAHQRPFSGNLTRSLGPLRQPRQGKRPAALDKPCPPSTRAQESGVDARRCIRPEGRMRVETWSVPQLLRDIWRCIRPEGRMRVETLDTGFGMGHCRN